MFEAILLGFIQGLTEFFPVSSTAHLILLPWFFGWHGDIDTLSFDVALHAGTLCALLLYFRKDWVEIILKKRKLLGLLVIATLPAGLAGLLLNDIVEQTLRSPYIITVSLVLVGVIMLSSERSKKERNIDTMNVRDAFFIGVSQAVALIPGVSRSGITISAGLFRKLERESAARFSFLLATPIVAVAALLHSKRIFSGSHEYDLQLFGAGFLVSAVTGFAAIKFLLAFFRKYSLAIFVYYRFILAVVIMIEIWLKR